MFPVMTSTTTWRCSMPLLLCILCRLQFSWHRWLHATSTQSADTKVMQVNAVQATSRLFDADSETIAPQVSAVTAAAEDLPAETRQRDISGFVMLLQGQLHPDADSRMTAAQMRKMPWVKSATDEALPKCPISF